MGVMPWADNGGGEWSQYENIKAGLKCVKNWDSCKPGFGMEEEEVKEFLN